MAEIIDITKYLPDNNNILEVPEELASLDEIFMIADMSTDDLVAELAFRYETGESINDLSDDILLTELTSRLVMFENLCLAFIDRTQIPKN